MGGLLVRICVGLDSPRGNLSICTMYGKCEPELGDSLIYKQIIYDIKLRFSNYGYNRVH